MPKIKNRVKEDYDFAMPLKVSINGKNLPRYELDIKPVMPKEESELEKTTKPFEYGRLPQTVCLTRFKNIKAGKRMLRIKANDIPTEDKVPPLVVSKRSLAYDQDQSILAFGESKGFKPKKY